MSPSDRPSEALVAAVDALWAAVDDALGADESRLMDVEVEQALLAVIAGQDRLRLVVSRLADTWARRGAWMADGSLSAAARLCTATRASQASCARLLRDAAALEQMPVVAEAIVDGRLSADVAPLFARANSAGREHLFQRDQHVLVDACAELRYADAARAVRYWIIRADAELVDAAADGDVDSTGATTAIGNVHASTTLDGTVAVDGLLDATAGEIVVNELDRLIRDLQTTFRRTGGFDLPARGNQLDNGADTDSDNGSDGERTGGFELPALSRSEWRALALVEMAKRSATAPADGIRPRPLISVIVGARALENLCETTNGTVLSPGQARRLLDDALIESILFDGPKRLISVSQRRTFTGALRTAIRARDRRCQHPAGCDRPASRCDVDHIQPAARGGPTSQWNGRLECVPHNRHHLLHDHATAPPPDGPPPTTLDELRVRLRWQFERDTERALDHRADHVQPQLAG